MPFETFDHTADLGLRVSADTRDQLFAEAARALFSLIVPDLDSVRASETHEFSIVGQEPEYLLFDWLNELLYAFEVRRLLLSRFEVRVGSEGLTATAHGEPLDPARHELDHEVKAITYHGLKVEQQANLWRAEIIVDI